MSHEINLPLYQCHKRVRAVKIHMVYADPHGARLAYENPAEPPGSQQYMELRVDHGYVKKHQPVRGGYYVLYDDGYESFSPAEAFEKGYTKL